MNRLFLLLLSVSIVSVAISQNVNVLLKEGLNFERSLKEEEALASYQRVLTIDKNNVQALIRSAELSCAIGARQVDKKSKLTYFTTAKDFANAALLLDSNNADANYIRAVVAGKFTEIETDNKKIIENVKNIKLYADKALQLNPKHAKAYYVLGKWNFEMINLAWAKRAAVKLFYGGLPNASIENAVAFMEKARVLDQYFVMNYLDLAKAYKYDDKPARAIEVLNKLVKLPTRTADDASLKEEGKRMLSEMQ
ncbi:MAG: hypothetical protein LH478_09290 [Chitinophagaceae bacterium]|nr:hypothetical protein [Chitinophagaceae bacterium]